jgi:hypothetical protein
MGWGGPGYGGPPPRPTGVTLAAIYLIVMGVLIALAGAACGVFGSAVGTADTQFPGLGGLGMGIAVIGIILLILGILSIVAGAGALGGKGWARWTGIIISVLLAILLILGGVSSFTATNGATGGLTTLVIGVLYALTAWALISATAFFSFRR